MSDPAPRGPLITWSSGPEDREPVLLLHDRYGDYDQLDRFAAGLANMRRVIRVRGARTQMEDTGIKGYYWFIGPIVGPELSTFGDALHHLETLVLSLSASGPTGSVSILGQGEGATMALMLALIWPERISRIVSMGGAVPENRDSFPIALRRTDAGEALLMNRAGPIGETAATLRDFGWKVEETTSDDDIVSWLTR